MEREFHPEAEAEFIESAAHYEGEVPGLGKQIRPGGEGGLGAASGKPRNRLSA